MKILLEFEDDQLGTSVQKINTILLLLGEGKFKDTYHIIQNIQNQTNSQIQKAAQSVENEEIENIVLPKK
jgi:hypothetical protein